MSAATMPSREIVEVAVLPDADGQTAVVDREDEPTLRAEMRWFTVQCGYGSWNACTATVEAASVEDACDLAIEVVNSSDAWRPLVPHVGYQLGWRRLSCMACIFMSADQAASLRFIAPDLFARLASYEQTFGRTIKRGLSLHALAERGRPYGPVLTRPDLVRLALSREWDQPIRASPATWSLPAGANGERVGPS